MNQVCCVYLQIVNFIGRRSATIPLVNSPSVIKRLCSSVYDPPYLDSLKPPIPIYEELTVQIKGYDFAVLENFQSCIHKIAMILDINVDEW